MLDFFAKRPEKKYFLRPGKNYFEGWYFKHQKDGNIIIVIPGIAIAGDSEDMIRNPKYKKYAFIQIIINEKFYCIKYPITECIIAKKQQLLKIGDNIFCRKGIQICIHTSDLELTGTAKYRNLTPIRYPIMGIFRFLPFMECHHEILSMHHYLQGNFMKDNTKISLNRGIGYIEKDWGCSFPKNYQWLQCNSFLQDKCALTVSIAEIPFLGMHFRGCICVIHYRGIEYRLATYLGVSIKTCNDREICLKQGRNLLRISIQNNNQPKFTEDQRDKDKKELTHKLMAPDSGKMTRTIQERNFCQISCEFYVKNNLLFQLTSNLASLEIVK